VWAVLDPDAMRCSRKAEGPTLSRPSRQTDLTRRPPCAGRLHGGAYLEQGDWLMRVIGAGADEDDRRARDYGRSTGG